jgi:hypothetical protein
MQGGGRVGLAAALLGGLSLAVLGFGSAQAAPGGMGVAEHHEHDRFHHRHGHVNGVWLRAWGPHCYGTGWPACYGFRYNDCYSYLRLAYITGSRYFWSRYELCRL